MCHAVRAPGVKCTVAAANARAGGRRDGVDVDVAGEPVGRAPLGVDALRVICMASSLAGQAAAGCSAAAGRSRVARGAERDRAGQRGQGAVAECDVEEAAALRESWPAMRPGIAGAAVGDEVDRRQQSGALGRVALGEQGAHAAGEGRALGGAGDGAGRDERRRPRRRAARARSTTTAERRRRCRRAERWPAVLRPASGAPSALGAMNEAKIDSGDQRARRAELVGGDRWSERLVEAAERPGGDEGRARSRAAAAEPRRGSRTCGRSEPGDRARRRVRPFRGSATMSAAQAISTPVASR